MRIIATLLVMLAGFALQAPEPILGYGGWRFGMTPEEVQAVESAAPYTAVNSTGGLETTGGTFGGEQTNVSFIFGPKGLHYIQIWAYEGTDFDEAAAALHSAYQHLSEKVGRLQLNGQILERDLTVETLIQHLPPEFGPSERTISEEQMKESGSFNVHPIRLGLEPITPRPGSRSYALFQKVPEMVIFHVMVIYRLPPQ